MLEFLKKFDLGAEALFRGAMTLDLMPDVRLQPYPPTGIEGMKEDAERIADCWRAVGADISEAIKKYELQKGKSVVPSKRTSVKDDSKSVAGVMGAYEGCCGLTPPPSLLEEFEHVYPGAAREILDMAKDEQKMCSEALVARHNENMRVCDIQSVGRRYAFLVFIGLIAVCCYAMFCKMEAAACWTSVAIIAFAAKTGVRAFTSKGSSECRD